MIALAFIVGIFAIAAIAILLVVRSAATPPSHLDTVAPILTDWDVAQTCEKPEPDGEGIDYRWLNITGLEED